MTIEACRVIYCDRDGCQAVALVMDGQTPTFVRQVHRWSEINGKDYCHRCAPKGAAIALSKGKP